jgi:hypothetical protein
MTHVSCEARRRVRKHLRAPASLLCLLAAHCSGSHAVARREPPPVAPEPAEVPPEQPPAPRFASANDVPSDGNGFVRAAWRLHADPSRNLIAVELTGREIANVPDDMNFCGSVTLRDVQTDERFLTLGSYYDLAPSGEVLPDDGAPLLWRVIVLFEARAETREVQVLTYTGGDPMHPSPVRVQDAGWEPLPSPEGFLSVPPASILAWQSGVGGDPDAHRLVVSLSNAVRFALPDASIRCGAEARRFGPTGMAEIDDRGNVLDPMRALPGFLSERRFAVELHCDHGHALQSAEVNARRWEAPGSEGQASDAQPLPSAPIPSNDALDRVLRGDDPHVIATLPIEGVGARPALSRDGRIALVIEGAAVAVIDAEVGRRVGRIDPPPRHALRPSLALSDDGRRAAVLWNVGRLDLYSLADPAAPVLAGSVRARSAVPESGPMTFARDGTRLFVPGTQRRSTRTSNAMTVVRLADHRVEAEIAIASRNTWARSTSILDGGAILACAGDHTVSLWSPPSWERRAIDLPEGASVTSCTSSGDRAVLGTDDGRIFVADADGHVVRTLRAHEGPVVAIVATSDAIVSFGREGRLTVHSESSDEPRVLIDGESVVDVAMLGDDSVLALTNRAYVLGIDGRSRAAVLPMHWTAFAWPTLSAPSANGRIVAVSRGSTEDRSVVRILRAR